MPQEFESLIRRREEREERSEKDNWGGGVASNVPHE
jgi:hypothetical protein